MCRMSTTRLRSALLLATHGAMLANCASDSGPARTENHTVGSFHAIDLRGAAEMLVEVGKGPALSITAGERVLQATSTEVRDGVLVVLVREQGGWFQRGQVAKLTVQAPTRDAVEFETFYIAGAKVQSHHTASAELRGGEPYVACRAVATGGEFPLIVALAQSAEGRELVLLAQNSEGAWALEASAAVEPTIQEFCAAESGEDILVAYTAATEQSAAVNSCRWLRFQH